MENATGTPTKNQAENILDNAPANQRHQVKRMLASRGKPVTYLKRLSMGPIALDPGLAPGAWRPLRQEELASLGR